MSNAVPDRVSSKSDVVELNPTVPAPASIPQGKRPRRMRSAQGAAHYGNGQKGKKGPGVNGKQPSKIEYHDRKSAAPIFLQKTFEMINTCDPALAGWTPDGTMFVIKEQKVFEQLVIPKFFDHNKFSSFARQLNFYGFRKMQSRAIYKNDVNKENAKHVTFFNEKFQRGKPQLLKEISRSTRGGQHSQTQQEMQKEINELKTRVGNLETTISRMQNEYGSRFAVLETQLQQLFSYSDSSQPISYAAASSINQMQFSNDPYPVETPTTDIEPIKLSPNEVMPVKTEKNDNNLRPTLKPHPNSKVLPKDNQMPPPPPLDRPSLQKMDSTFMRGLSSYSLGDGLGDELADMAPFERKLFQNTMSAPDPIEPVPLERPSLTRELSQGFDKLDLNEFPPLTNV